MKDILTRESGLCGFTIVYWILYLVCFELRIPRPDAIGYFAYAQSILTDGDLSLFDQFVRWGIDPVFVQQTALGHLNNFFACGVAVLWLPVLCALHLFLRVATFFGSTQPTDGYSTLYLGTAAFSSAVYGYLGLVLSYRCACRYVSCERAAWATLCICFFSPLWYYVSIEGSMSHAASAFCAALFVFLLLPLWQEDRRDVSKGAFSWLVLGYVGGLLSMVRWQDSLLPIYVAGGLVIDTIRDYRERASCRTLSPLVALASYVLAFVAAFLPQMIVWQVQNGEPLIVPQGNQFFVPLRPAVGTVLFSSSHSLFAWTPLVLPAVLGGAFLLWRRDRRLASLLATIFVLQTYVNAIVIDPSAGASFGGRRFLGLTPFFVVGLAIVFERLPLALSGLVVLICGLWTAAIWLVFVHAWIDPVRYVSFQDLLSAAARIRHFLPGDIVHLQPRSWHLGGGPQWLLVSLASAATLIVGFSIYASFRRPFLSQKSAVFVTGIFGLAGIIVFSAAAARSEPMPVTGVRIGRHTVLDFGWYANARFDGDPFFGQAHVLGEFSLPARLQWGSIPFELLPPTRDANTAASNLTTCGLPMQHFRVSLAPQPTRAVHFALCGLGAVESGVPVVTIGVDTESGERVERTLHADQDIWDFFGVPPANRLVHNSSASVSGFTLPLPDASIPLALQISSPISPAPIWPCSAIFAVTQELIEPSPPDSRASYQSVSLSEIANADYAQNAFRPATVLNFYPDLKPGLLNVEDVPFLILNHASTPHDASAMSVRAFGKRGIRLPLNRVPTDLLSLLIAELGSDLIPREVGEVKVEYVDGERLARPIWSPRDVVNCANPEPESSVAWHATGAQKLSKLSISLQGRTPKYLWLMDSANTPVETENHGLTVFAITQTTSE